MAVIVAASRLVWGQRVTQWGRKHGRVGHGKVQRRSKSIRLERSQCISGAFRHFLNVGWAACCFDSGTLVTLQTFLKLALTNGDNFSTVRTNLQF